MSLNKKTSFSHYIEKNDPVYIVLLLRTMYQQFAIFSLNSSLFGRNSSKNVEKLKKILPKTQDFFPKTQNRGLIKICGELETCPKKKSLCSHHKKKSTFFLRHIVILPMIVQIILLLVVVISTLYPTSTSYILYPYH